MAKPNGPTHRFQREAITMTAQCVRTAEPRLVTATPVGRQLLCAGHCIPRHVHARSYMAVVVEGSYWEANGAGRRHLRVGDVAVHGPYSAHCNDVGDSGAIVVNIAVEGALADAFGRIEDIDAVVRASGRDSTEVRDLVLSALKPVSPVISDWPDQLAADISVNPKLCLGDWALQHGLALETVSRGFRRLYGATPRQVRFEQRARRALVALLYETTPLAQLSLSAGFADQASMTHAIRSLTGASPLALRRKSSGDKTDGRVAAIIRS
jgi:AraC-like DNA-binding protein